MQSYMFKVLRVGEPERSVRVVSTELAHRYWNRVIKKQTWFDENKEHLVVLLLSARHDVEGYSLVSIGTLNETLAHPREIFRVAVLSGSHAIIVMHNHPSGDPSPSERDRSLTRRLADVADLLQIKLLDHVIVGRRRSREQLRIARTLRSRRKAKCICEGYFSFKESGFPL